jgi:hypothetical protein
MAEFNRETSTFEKVATVGSALISIASALISLVNMIENLQGKTDEAHGKDPGLETAGTALSISGGVLSFGLKGMAAKRAIQAKSVAPGHGVKAESVSSSRPRANSNP